MRSNNPLKNRTVATLAALLIGLCLTGLPAVAQSQEDADERSRELQAQIRDAAEAADWEAMASDWAQMGEHWAEMGERIGESFADADWDAWAEQWEEFGERMEHSFDSDDWREFEREMERLGESIDGDVAASVESALESIDWDSLGDFIGMSIESALAGLEDIEITIDDDGSRKPRE